MNFLAHLYLSGSNPDIQVGNFLAEGIRSKQYLSFPESIQKGILLHREIDTFTDAHPEFRKSTKRLHGNYHHYAPVIVDLYYDHFLAKNWTSYSEVSLDQSVSDFYQLLGSYSQWFTPKAKTVYPSMVKYNWLKSYESVHGLKPIFIQMDARTKNFSGMSTATDELTAFYDEFNSEFTAFFPEIVRFCADKLASL